LRPGDTVARIPVSRIDADRPLYDISYRREAAARKVSLRPEDVLFLLVGEGERYRPVYGASFLEGVAPDAEVSGLVADPAVPPPHLFFSFLLFESAVWRLNEVEKAAALAEAVALYGKETAGPLEAVMACLDIPATSYMLSSYLRLRELEEPWLELLAEGRITMKTALAAGGGAKEERKCFLHLFRSVDLTARMQEMVLEGVRDLVKVRGCRTSDVCRELDFSGLFDDAALSPRRKGEILADRVHRALHPRFSADTERFRRAAARLGLGRDIRCTPPPAFETSAYTFSFSASSPEEFRERVEQLVRMGRSGADLEALFEL